MPAGFDYEMWLGPAPQAPYTVDRCKPQGTYWIYDQSIGYLGGWGAHPLDILVWCYDGDQAGPFTVEGTGVVPTEGLYDTVYDWDMTLQMADGVKITFDAGFGQHEVHRHEGPTGVDPQFDSCLSRRIWFPTICLATITANNGASHIQVFADSIRSRQQASSPIDDAVRSDVISHLCDIAVRTGEKITWDPETSSRSPAAATRLEAWPAARCVPPWTL